MFDRPTTPGSTAAAAEGTTPPERVMRIAPLDLRQQRFKKSVRGFDPTEVVAFLTEAADDYEHALREIDRLRQDLSRMEALLIEHREREANLRNTLLTAQRAAEEIRETSRREAEVIVKQAELQADHLLELAQSRAHDVERGILDLHNQREMLRGDVRHLVAHLTRVLDLDQESDQDQVLHFLKRRAGQQQG